jgi:hypothetical protein
MRRPFLAAIPSLLAMAALLSVAPAAVAQRAGGGHGGGFGGGHASGFGGGGAGHSFGGGFGGSSGRFSASAPRNFSAAPRMSYSLPARGFAPGYRSNYSASRQAFAGRGRDNRYRAPYRGYGGYGGYPYATGWQLTPWELGYPDFLGYGNDIGDPQPSADMGPVAGDAGAGPEDDYRPEYGAGSDYRPAPYAASAPASEPELTLIFNDGRRQPIRNYALTSESVIVLDNAASGRQQSIPLSDLNLQATEQAAQQAGLEFTPPA